MQCLATTQSNTQCSRTTDKEYCWQHQICDYKHENCIYLPDKLVQKFPLTQYYIEPVTDKKLGTVYFVYSLEDENKAIDRVPQYYDKNGNLIKRNY